MSRKKKKTTLVFLLSPLFSNYIGGWSGVFSLNCMAVTFYIFPSRMILADCMASKYASGRFFLAAGKEENYQQPLQQGLYNFPAGLGFGFVVKSRAPPLRTPDNRRNSSYIKGEKKKNSFLKKIYLFLSLYTCSLLYRGALQQRVNTLDGHH